MFALKLGGSFSTQQVEIRRTVTSGIHFELGILVQPKHYFKQSERWHYGNFSYITM